MADLPYLSGGNISWHQISKLRVFFLHEIPLFSIFHGKQPATFPSGRLADEYAFSTTFHSCRMVLDHLAICQRNTKPEQFCGDFSCIAQRTRCISKQSVHTTGGNNNRIPR